MTNPIALILWSVWGAMVLVALWRARQYYCGAYWTNWYDQSRKGPLQELEWQQIRDVMELEQDPLDNKPCWRGPSKRVCRDLAVFAITVLFFAGSFLLICDLDRWRAVAGSIGGLGLPASLAALGGTAIAIFYNVRLTARARHRQLWINSVREHLGNVIGNFAPQGRINEEHAKNWETNLTMLELLINPGERVHRSLMAILRLMHGIHDHPADRKVLRNLGLALSPGEQMPGNQEAGREYRGELKVKATRLANVLLKREWEQVKHVR